VVDWLGEGAGCGARVGKGQVTAVRSGTFGLVIHSEPVGVCTQ
jgi:hypothetical protein